LSWSYQCILDNAECGLLGASKGVMKIYLNATSNTQPATRNQQHANTQTRNQQHANTQTRKHATST